MKGSQLSIVSPDPRTLIEQKQKQSLQSSDCLQQNESDSCSSDFSASGDEFFDACSDVITESKTKTSTNDSNWNPPNTAACLNMSITAAVTSIPGTMADSGVYSMHSSHADGPLMTSSTTDIIEIKTEDLPVQSTLSTAPQPPPRTKKKKSKSSTGHCSSGDNTGNHSSAESRSVTNSTESNTIAQYIPPYQNSMLTSILDEIVSIKGDLSITEMDDKKSAFQEDFDRQSKPRNFSPNKEMLFTNEQLTKISENIINNEEEKSKQQISELDTAKKNLTNAEVLNQVVVMDINTGEKLPLSKAENILPKCLNPLSLHLMKLTNTDMSDTAIDSKETSSNIADSTFKSVTSLISSTLNEMKIEKKERTLEKKNKKKLLESLGSIVSASSSLTPTPTNETNPIASNDLLISNNDDDDEYEDEDDEDNFDKNFKNGKLRSKIRDLKRIGTGLIKGVKGTSSSLNKRRSTFHVDPIDVDVVPPAPPRYKIKVNHKRGSADFDGLKLIQEINDCKGAIWCMKFSNCSQLLAAAGQDHLLRVYCSQKSWKYFTQLRNKASGQHVSPNSTKEHSSNGSSDSFGRKTQKSSYSRNGSLNTCDSHNNSSSSSNSSALAKEFYKDEDNTLSEEGPLLLFTIYRGHTADVLDLAWSKNHFLLSSSMDKTVRLWHITRIECLCTFRHIDFVTTIQFHPRDDRYFLSGSLDGKLRLWNIPDKRVTLWNEVPPLSTQRGSNNSNNSSESNMIPSHGLITASSFVQNGKFAVIGTYDGRIIFYTTDQLKYFTQIHVNNKNVGSSNQSGATRRFRSNKVTGIESIDANNKILVTTNDSRLRLYDLRDLSLTCKYKGCINQSSQIKASVSHDHKYIICGSENNSFYIWRIQDNSTIGQRRDRNKQYECIRLLNLPSQPPSHYNIAPVNENTSKEQASTSTSSNSLPAMNQQSSADTSSVSTIKNSYQSSDTNKANPNGSSTFAATNSQYSSQSQAYSNAATKIVTSAIFAQVPGQIDEKSRYVIGAADFNGFIRIFSI
ncbi:WD repeat-containing protein 44-like protein [Sarcoptes scabiei]|nr:WD repeat-containing protein 44-like protein [Sarcoptes scabiei]